ncbi:hypothetical protein ACIPLR_06695 [Herbaspirillum huttiense]|jgi:hypothetical protein|uniref:hypothetical protein n=1 Tax=Herbaspirillum TaxID=963 RepID=UPI001AE10AAE|nr:MULTISPECIES: hypothetical protein [Herbaspirillum]MCP3658610.1 hypothetical protein [Herbaspirillum sp.]MCP3948952.1 hypothetical protein [Herbaspirillum sp.]MCP4030101.1 hypothetical protein [Herbaspirillum sp.]MCP4555405.1 hypothetical protein [Herbaspirillum sp.]MEE1636946.1 hypothetical protein [Herbaspirillum huttiense NC40101]
MGQIAAVTGEQYLSGNTTLASVRKETLTAKIGTATISENKIGSATKCRGTDSDFSEKISRQFTFLSGDIA